MQASKGQLHCFFDVFTVCQPFEFRCNVSNECVKEWKWCDGNKDCSDGNDEIDGCEDGMASKWDIIITIVGHSYLFSLFYFINNNS